MTKPISLSETGHGRNLGSDERLLVGLNGRCGGLEILLGSSREIGRLQLRGLSSLDQRLRLGGVVSHILLSNLGGLLGVLLRNGAELSSLGIDDLPGMLQLAVDKLLVGGVDEGGEEGDSRGDHGKTPVRDDLDEVVRKECAEGGLEFCQSIIPKAIALRSLGILGWRRTAAEAEMFSANKMR